MPSRASLYPEEAGGTMVYEVALGYDDHRRINGMTNSLETPFRGTETIADYTFTHDDNGNPLTQAADGMADFSDDDRVFAVDRLDRLTATEYLETARTESSTLDLVGNREEHTNRAGDTTAYGPVNEANEYADIAGNAVSYDEAGNLSVDEDGRQYFYDEHNRLTEIKAADDTVLAEYTYDALGRRIAFEDPVAGVTTRYYYAGQQVIEERDASDTLTRYHLNGPQYLDEHIATFATSGRTTGSSGRRPAGRGPAGATDSSGRRLAGRGTPSPSSAGETPAATSRVPHRFSGGGDRADGAFTYYLMNQNFSIAGTGNADGSVIERLDYSSGGDFADGGSEPGDYFFDADEDGDVDLDDYADFWDCLTGPGPVASDRDQDGDVDLDDYAAWSACLQGPGVVPTGDVDLADFTEFQGCYGTTTPACLAAFDFDADGQSDGSVDLADLVGFEHRLRGSNFPPGGGCPTIPAARATGTGAPSLQRWGTRNDLPPSGTFALHGRPVDVLSDGHVLFYIRAR